MKLLSLIATIVLIVGSPNVFADTAYITKPNTLTADEQAELRQIIVRLNHALDAADYPMYAGLFAEDAQFISGFGIATGPKEIAAALEQSRPFITGKRHVAANYLFSGDSNKAIVTTYLVVFERETAIAYVGSAINIDTFVKRDGKWALIRHDSALDPSTVKAMQQMMGQSDKQ